MTLAEFVAQVGAPPEDGKFYWVVESQLILGKRSERDRTTIVEAYDMGSESDSSPEDRWWFYSCGSDIYKEFEDLERVIGTVEDLR